MTYSIRQQQQDLRFARHKVATVQRVSDLLQDVSNASYGDWRNFHGHGDAPDFKAFDDCLQLMLQIVEGDLAQQQGELLTVAGRLAAAREVVRQEEEDNG